MLILVHMDKNQVIWLSVCFDSFPNFSGDKKKKAGCCHFVCYWKSSVWLLAKSQKRHLYINVFFHNLYFMIHVLKYKVQKSYKSDCYIDNMGTIFMIHVEDRQTSKTTTKKAIQCYHLWQYKTVCTTVNFSHSLKEKIFFFFCPLIYRWRKKEERAFCTLQVAFSKWIFFSLIKKFGAIKYMTLCW